MDKHMAYWINSAEHDLEVAESSLIAGNMIGVYSLAILL